MNRRRKNEKGFTLVEMMVSIGLFSVVLVVMLGSIITIVDVNRKAQSITVVMNDVNFALESITRTIKTGELVTEDDSSSAGTSYSSIEIINQDGDDVIYSFDQENGTLTRQVNNDDPIAITSSQIILNNVEFTVFDNNSNKQPRVLILVEGTVQASPKISSSFRVQTSVSQRNLDSDDL